MLLDASAHLIASGTKLGLDEASLECIETALIDLLGRMLPTLAAAAADDCKALYHRVRSSLRVTVPLRYFSLK